MAADPQLESYVVPELCSLGVRSYLMTGLFVQWFRTHFSREAYIEHPELRTRIWRAVDPGEILIESATRYKPETTGQRPAIIVKRNDWEVEHTLIGDQVQGDLDLTGTEHFARLVSGSHTLFCLSPNAAEAEILGMEVYRELSQFGPVIRRMADLLRFVPVKVGGLAQLEESRKTYAVPVTVAYVYWEKWVLFPHSPVLKKVLLSMFL